MFECPFGCCSLAFWLVFIVPFRVVHVAFVGLLLVVALVVVLVVLVVVGLLLLL